MAQLPLIALDIGRTHYRCNSTNQSLSVLFRLRARQQTTNKLPYELAFNQKTHAHYQIQSLPFLTESRLHHRSVRFCLLWILYCPDHSQVIGVMGDVCKGDDAVRIWEAIVEHLGGLKSL